MAVVQMRRLRKLVPVISNRMAGKTKGIVRKMKELGIIKEDEFLDDVNPPDKVLEKLADSENENILEYLKTEMIKEKLQDIVLEIITGKTTQTRNPTENYSSSADVASDSSRSDLRHKPESHLDEFRKMMQDFTDATVDGMKREIQQAVATAMNEIKPALKKEFKEMTTKFDELNKDLLEKFSSIEKSKDDLKRTLKTADTKGIDEASYTTLQLKYRDLERKYNEVSNDLDKQRGISSKLTEKIKGLRNEIDQLKRILIDKQPNATARRNVFSKLQQMNPNFK